MQELADVEAFLVAQGDELDRDWIGRLVELLFGARDPRFARWRELTAQN